MRINKIILLVIVLSALVLSGCGNSKEVYAKAFLEPAADDVEWAIVKLGSGGDTGTYDFTTYSSNYLDTNYHKYPYKVSSSELRKYNRKDLYQRMESGNPIDCRLSFDKNTNTYWEMENSGSNEYILMSIDEYGPFKDSSEHKIIRKDGAPYKMLFYNGHPTKYQEYGRVKKLVLEMYETGEVFVKVDPKIIPEGYRMDVTNASYLIYKKEFELKDTLGFQSVPLNFPDMHNVYRPDDEVKFGGKIRYGGVLFRMKFLDIYPGTKYSNTCITEIRFVYE